MVDKHTREEYRRMTTSQRLAITLQMMREDIPRLLLGTLEGVDRRFELIRQENDERNRKMLTAIARTRDKSQCPIEAVREDPETSS